MHAQHRRVDQAASSSASAAPRLASERSRCGSRQRWYRLAVTRLDELLQPRLADLRRQQRFRDPETDIHRGALLAAAADAGTTLIDACSNDYLGLAATPIEPSTAPAGGGASRLVHGGRAPHLALERELAEWCGVDAALLFSSGYAANVGLLSALLDPDDFVVSDGLNHASLIDGCRLARVKAVKTPHNDVAAVAVALASAPPRARRWVIVESYYSMDGDGPDLAALREVCDRHSALLIVDEAHALGVFGPEGRGRAAAAGVQPDVLVGTFGKSFGASGAFVAGAATLRTWLWNRARSFVFSTAGSPALAEALRERLRAVRQAEAARATLNTACSDLRTHLRSHAVPVPSSSFGPIVPVILGSNDRALSAAASLERSFVLAQPIRPPTVPEGTARLRITLKATHGPDDLTRLKDSLVAACAS